MELLLAMILFDCLNKILSVLSEPERRSGLLAVVVVMWQLSKMRVTFAETFIVVSTGVPLVVRVYVPSVVAS